MTIIRRCPMLVLVAGMYALLWAAGIGAVVWVLNDALTAMG